MDAFLLVNIIKMPQNMQVIAVFVSVMSAVITMISVVVAVVKMWQKWSLKMAEHKESVVNEIDSLTAEADIRQWKGKLYRCIQSHTTQTDWMPDKEQPL